MFVCQKSITFIVVCTLGFKLNQVGMKFVEFILDNSGLFWVNLYSLFALADFHVFTLYTS